MRRGAARPEAAPGPGARPGGRAGLRPAGWRRRRGGEGGESVAGEALRLTQFSSKAG